MAHSDYDSQKNQEGSHKRSNPGRTISEKSLDFEAGDFESQEEVGDEAQPNDKAVSRHVEIIVVEVGKDTILHTSSLSQMSDDEISCVVEAVSYQNADPESCERTGGDSHKGNHKETGSEHAACDCDDCSEAANVSSSVVVCLIFVPRKELANVTHYNI